MNDDMTPEERVLFGCWVIGLAVLFVGLAAISLVSIFVYHHAVNYAH